MELEINALAQSLNAQAAIGSLIAKTLGQTEELIKQQVAQSAEKNVQQVASPVGGMGESVDIVA